MKSRDRSHGHDITIAFLLRHELHWAYIPSTLFGIQFVEWVKKKNLLPTNKKVREKNQILKYHALSLKRTMKKIQDWSMKNLLTQWDTEKENQKILSIFGKKPLNLVGN